MADNSDEEFERHRGRDKFRRERNDYERRGERRRDGWEHERSRDQWSSRSRERREPHSRGDYDSRRRERYSPPRHEMSPPHMKRMRRDWDDVGGGNNYPPRGDMGYQGPMHGGPPPHHFGPGPEMGNIPPQGPFNHPAQNRIEVDYPTQPALLSFKMFLSQQDDSISDQDAIKKYNDYKDEFRRQQINEFFLAHKDEEWFKSKYHPEECDKRREDQMRGLHKRLQVFIDLFKMGRISSVSVDTERSDDLIKLVDAAVIKMEGGTDFDLGALDEPFVQSEKEDGPRSRNNSESMPQEKSTPEEKKRKRENEEEGELDPDDNKMDDPVGEKETQSELNDTPTQDESPRKSQEFTPKKTSPNGHEEGESTEKNKKRKRSKAEYNYESGSDSDSGSASDSESEPGPPGLGSQTSIPGFDSQKSETGGDSAEKKENLKKDKADEKDVDTADEEEKEPRPRPLHKMCSIFLRNLAPTITKQEVEAMCRRYEGFIRVALQDPQPERRFFRRGWVTFDRSVNIKDICWSLNNIRLRDCELGAIVNRELRQRVRPINGITAHRQILRQDIQIAAKVIQNLDDKWQLWEDPNTEKQDQEKQPSFCLISKNPVLKNITEYLVEEGSYEEEELLGQSMDDKQKDANSEVILERDESLIQALDRMILYLRIVHSIDYYSASEYPNEDEMPHRCGIMHARGGVPVNRITQSDISDWINHFEGKIKNFVEVQEPILPEDAEKLGRKAQSAEVEKFVTANTQELAKDKWLCPLSGKKFKGPEFVRKHIFTKHNEKIEEVKKEVSFFNNFLMDSKRPHLPEHPGNRHPSGRGDFGNPNFQGGPPQQGMMGPRPPMMYGGRNPKGAGPPGPPYHPRRDEYRGENRRPAYPHKNFSRRPDPRGIIEYRDLDAPDDIDIF